MQLVIGIPDAVCKRSKKLDIEMMMKRKINRVKKENQVYMHKVHVLCWLGHGNFVSCVLNDQEILTAALSLVPSKECYPGDRVDMKYVEQITLWYKDKLTLKQDKHEDKFRPKSPPLKEILLKQMKSRVVSTKKYLVFIFVSMLRAIGLQCRVMFNFVTLPIRPPMSELCSLSTKPKEENSSKKKKDKEEKEPKKRPSNYKSKSTSNIPQVDGNYDERESDMENIMQVDGNDDALVGKTNTRSKRVTKNTKKNTTSEENADVSPPKRSRKGLSLKPKSTKTAAKGEIVDDKMGVDLPLEKNYKKKHQEELEDNPTDGNKRIENMQVLRKPPGRRQQSLTERNKKGSSSATATIEVETNNECSLSSIKAQNIRKDNNKADKTISKASTTGVEIKTNPEIIVTDENNVSKHFNRETAPPRKVSLGSRKRSQTALPSTSQTHETVVKRKTKSLTHRTPRSTVVESKYFHKDEENSSKPKSTRLIKQEAAKEDAQRVSHKDLLSKNKPKPKNDIREDLIGIMKSRVKEAFQNSKRGKVKGMYQ